MKHLIYFSLIIYTAIMISCASQGNPTGGPKDTIPPTLVESYPAYGTTNYNNKTFTFTFDEKVLADKIKQNLIITPYTENPYKYQVKKNVVILKFEEPFDSLTTYTLNFADGITDITEKTPPRNLTLAFSTGPILDSLYIRGHIYNLKDNEPIKAAIVSLYSEADTVDVFTGKPRYFTKTDDEGNYTISNIKNGRYKLYAFDDKNNNLTCQPSTEIHGFKSGYIKLDSSINDLSIPLQEIDSRELKLSRGKNTGIYFDALYNKYITAYRVEKLSPSGLPIPKSNLISDNQTLRFYFEPKYRYEKDSLGAVVTVYDSLQNLATDTLYIKFKESKRKPANYNYEIFPSKASKIEDSLALMIKFDKPTTMLRSDSIYLIYDTIFYQNLSKQDFMWNTDSTVFNTNLSLDKKFFPHYVDSLLLNYQDTTITDSLYLLEKTYLERIDTTSFNIHFPQGAFASLENDSSKAINNKYFFKNNDKTGIVNGKVLTDHTDFVIVITTEKYKPVQRFRTIDGTYRFLNLKPGKYSFMILIDENKDGQWWYGNILKDIEPEPVYFYPEVFDVRANWELDNVNIQF